MEVRNRNLARLLVPCCVVAIVFCASVVMAAKTPEIPSIPKVDIRLGMMPFADHSQAIIGARMGWFKEVGINLVPAPYGRVLLEAEMPPGILSGSVDIGTTSTGYITASDNAIDNLIILNLGDFFHGYAIFAQPNSKYKTYADFCREGMSGREAIAAAAKQMKGKTFAHDPAPCTEGLREVAWSIAGMTADDVKITVMDDVKVCELALAGKVDFVEPTSGPLTLGLQVKGFKPIVTTRDLLEVVPPDVESAETLRVFTACSTNGLTVRKDWLKKPANYETAIRAVSVMYRIADYMNHSRDKAAKIHVDFLNPLIGQKFTVQEGKLLYTLIQTFMDFEDARRFFLDRNDPLYYEYLIRAMFSQYQKSGYLTKRQKYEPDDVTVAKQIYLELLTYRFEAEADIWRAEKLIAAGKAQKKQLTKTASLVKQAKYWHQSRNYLDASRFARAAVKWGEYELDRGIDQVL